MEILKTSIMDWLGIQRVNSITDDLVGKTSKLQHDNLTFKVFSANGGTIVEVMHDYRTLPCSRDNNGLYIITSDQDLGHELAKIFMLETLKKS